MTAADLTAWRERLALTRQQAAITIGCTRKTLAGYEAGKAAIPLYIALATAAIAECLPPIK